MICIQQNLKDEMIEMHLDEVGIDHLIALLQNLKKNIPWHEHLFTKEWGGEDLSSKPINMDSETSVINHLKIMAWPKKIIA